MQISVPEPRSVSRIYSPTQVKILVPSGVKARGPEVKSGPNDRTFLKLEISRECAMILTHYQTHEVFKDECPIAIVKQEDQTKTNVFAIIW